jgi:hypothetical protein
MLDCPKCHLTNPDTALRCDCGYDFASGTMQEPYLSLKERQSVGESKTEVVFGFISDAFLLTAFTWMFFTSRGWLKVFCVITIACVGAGKIWRYRNYLAPRLRKLPGH